MKYFETKQYENLTENQKIFVDMLFNALEFAKENKITTNYITVAAFVREGYMNVNNRFWSDDKDIHFDFSYIEEEDETE